MSEKIYDRKIKNRIVNYWTQRSDAFARQRYSELHSYMADLWLREIMPYLPQDKDHCRILDIGTGTGFFPLLLAKEGYKAEGIDLTHSMINEANSLARLEGSAAVFKVMDAENLDYADETFDVILTRNLTWTLPDPRKAYTEWQRVLKKGGVLLNFDADYGKEHLVEESKLLPKQHAHNKLGVDTLNECDAIKAELDISRTDRPIWDIKQLIDIGFSKVSADMQAGSRIYWKHDEFYNPMPVFLLTAEK